MKTYLRKKHFKNFFFIEKGMFHIYKETFSS